MNRYLSSFFLVMIISLSSLWSTESIAATQCPSYLKFEATSNWVSQDGENTDHFTVVSDLKLFDQSGSELDRSQWTLVNASSEELDEEDGRGTNAFDNDMGTFWHSQWSQAQPAAPHFIIINLNGSYDVTKLQYLTRQDGYPNGHIKRYKVFLSTDGINWGAAIKKGSFPDNTELQTTQWASACTEVVNDDADGDGVKNDVDNCPAVANVNQTDTDGDLKGNACDLDDDNDGVLDTADNCPININVDQTDTDSDGLGDACDSTPGGGGTTQCPSFVRFVSNSLWGNEPFTVASEIQLFDATGALIDPAQWTAIADSEELNAEDGRVTNAFDGDLGSFWHTQWGAAQPLPPHQITINMGAEHDVTKMVYLTRQDGWNNGHIKDYQMFVSTDGSTWTAVDSGTFTDTTTAQTSQWTSSCNEVVITDTDNDGIADSADNCPLIANPDQANHDTDNKGDACDTDDDNDGVADTADNCPINANTDQLNTDSDTQGNICDTDDDNDTILDVVDNCPVLSNLDQADADNDGIGDVCDSTSGGGGTTQCPSYLKFEATSNWMSQDGDNTDHFTVVSDLKLFDNSGAELDRSQWTLVNASSEELDEEDGRGTNAFDDNLGTFWHSQWSQAQPAAPHSIIINLNGEHDITKLQYLTRQDGYPNGHIKEYEVSVSDDGLTWKAVDNGTFADATTAQISQWTSSCTTTNQAPIASLTVDQASGDAPLTVLFDASGSTDADDGIKEYQWSFGPGTTAIITQAATATFSYSLPGNYNASVKVVDHAGASSTAVKPITVLPDTSINQPPVASITANQISGPSPLDVVFDASGSTDPNGLADIVSYEWTYDTGATSVTTVGATSTFTYTPVGSHEVSVKVTDLHGLSNVASTTVTVTDPSQNHAPSAVNDAVTTAFNTATASINVLANDTDADTGDVLSVESNTNASHGSIVYTAADNSFVYTPDTGFSGTDSFTYTVVDGHGGNAIATVTITVSQPPVTNTHLIGQWPLDGNADDLSSNQVNLNANGTWVAGKFDSALSMNGNSQNAQTQNAAALMNKQSVTISAWINPNASPADPQWEWVAAQADNYGLFITPDNKSAVFYIRDVNGDWTSISTPANSISYGQWQHVAGSYNAATNVLTVYVNGVATTSTAGGILYDTGNEFTIGSMQSGRYFDGLIDDVKVYDSALTQAQIDELVTPGSGGGVSKQTYEDAEDGNTTGWKVYDKKPAGASIANIFDTDLNSKVIELTGDKTKNGYMLGHYKTSAANKWGDSTHKIISWKQKYNERVTIYIATQTTLGFRFMQYSEKANSLGIRGNKNQYIHHGLGAGIMDGTWQTISRDLEADLQDFEPDNHILSVNGFLIRGSGRLDDIEMQ